MNARPFTKQRGLTLLEVMVALLIFALTGTAVMKAASEHIRGLGELEAITFATWVANNRLTQMQIDRQWPPKNKQKGSVEMAGQTWYWQQEVQKTTDSDLRQIEVFVGLDEQYQSSVTSVVTYLAKPAE